jgi:hypothetical protein
LFTNSLFSKVHQGEFFLFPSLLIKLVFRVHLGYTYQTFQIENPFVLEYWFNSFFYEYLSFSPN